MVISLRTAAAIASVSLLAACTAEVAGEGIERETLSIGETEAEASANASIRWAYEPHGAEAPPIRIECTNGFEPFICDGSCPVGQGCCVTGLRPLGFCTTLDECPHRCVVDCTEAALNRSVHEGAQCLSLCTWLAPEPSCNRMR
jgi:hypothetical protein